MTHPSAADPGRRNRTLRALGQIATQATTASIATVETQRRASARVPAQPAPARTPRQQPRRPVRGGRGYGLPVPMMVIIALMLVIITALGYERITGVSVLPSGLTAGVRPPPRKLPVLESSPPATIAIPAIRVNAPVQPVGIAADGSIAVPPAERPDTAGWYDQSPTPGQFGPSVIVGHVDTRTGPAVFHELGRLRPGERVEVTRRDGSVAVFQVETLKRFDKAQLPVDQVYGDYSRPGLRLITCGGRWVGGETGYADNVVVFAAMVEARNGAGG